MVGLRFLKFTPRAVQQWPLGGENCVLEGNAAASTGSILPEHSAVPTPVTITAPPVIVPLDPSRGMALGVPSLTIGHRL
jgi:hypothetical protein